MSTLFEIKKQVLGGMLSKGQINQEEFINRVAVLMQEGDQRTRHCRDSHRSASQAATSSPRCRPLTR